MNQKLKDVLKALTTKKALLSVALVGLPVVGIAVSPTFAENFVTHLSGLLQAVLDALPTEAADAAVSTASEIPAE